MLVVLANGIAWLLAYAVLKEWLNGFAYHVGLQPGPFLLGGGLAIFGWPERPRIVRVVDPEMTAQFRADASAGQAALTRLEELQTALLEETARLQQMIVEKEQEPAPPGRCT